MRSTLSLYTYLRNGLSLDFHVIPMIKHHLPLVDEMVILEGCSTDGTFEAITALAQAVNRLDSNKLHIVQEPWDNVPPGPEWWGTLSDRARVHCLGDWCLKMDADEFIPEWQFDELRELIETTDQDVLPIKFKNFYANYKVWNRRPERHRWIQHKWCLHVNRQDVHAVGDGSSVRVGDRPWDEDLLADAFELHHFGAVRHAARLRQKWRNDGAMKSDRPRFDKVPNFVYDLLPHVWLDKEYLPDLAVYEGPFIKPVVDDPDEFVRDGMQVYQWLLSRGQEKSW